MGQRQKYTTEQVAEILRLGREGQTFREVASATLIPAGVCRYYLKREGLHQDREPVVTATCLHRIRELAEQGIGGPDIGRRLRIDPSLVRHHLLRLGLYRKGSRPRLYSQEQRLQVLDLKRQGVKEEQIARVTGVARGSVRAFCLESRTLLTPDQQTLIRSSIMNPERSVQVRDLRLKGTPIPEIVRLTGVGRATLKSFFLREGIVIDPSVRAANAWAALGPDHTARMRTYLTPAVRHRAAQAIRTWFMEHPEVKDQIGEASRKWWATITPEQRSAMRPGGRGNGFHRAMLVREDVSSAEEFMRKLAGKYQGEFLGPYVSSKTPTWWRCSKGHEWQTIPNVVQQGHWCPACANLISRIQLELFAFVLSLAPDTVLNERKILRENLGHRGDLDVYVPSARLGIELDGLFWHSDSLARFKRNKSRDKAIAAWRTGLKHLMIFEDEWRHRRPLVEEMIRLRLGQFRGVRLNARDLQVGPVPRDVERDFFERSHLGGHVGSRYALGLFAQERLAACMSVRTDRRGDLEIARLATDPDLLVRGSAGRLLAAVRAREPGRRVVTYSDNRLSQGAVYQTLGFREETLSHDAGYYYTDFKTRVWRWRCRRINSPDVLAEFPTEALQAAAGVFSPAIFGDERSLFRIEDCGHRRWVLD